MAQQKWSVLFLALSFSLTAACGPSVNNADDDDDDTVDNCPEGYADCDGKTSNGCETDVSSSVDHCGDCNIVCGTNNANPQCVNSVCQMNCEGGWYDCNSTPGDGCEAQLGTQNNCSSCNDGCYAANATGECVGNECVYSCPDGWDDCNDDMADGCESDLTETEHCGACTSGCAGVCQAGQCETCDSSLALDSTDPVDAAKAIGICDGLVSAKWVLPDGSDPGGAANYDVGHGILSGFGSNVAPRDGDKLLALSSGTGRQPSDPGYQDVGGYDKTYTCNHPQGFPKESPACPGVTTGQPHDGVGLEVELTVPEWAEGFSFDFDFYTFEWPTYVCSTYNDFFVAMLDPIPEGQTDGNISFDSEGNPVSVNNGLVEACGCTGGPPCTAGGLYGPTKTYTCALGTDTLQGTGFEGDILTGPHAATGWLVTTAPAEPGTTIKLRFAIYDSGDGVLDSTTIIDNFRWLPKAPDVGTNPIE